MTMAATRKTCATFCGRIVSRPVRNVSIQQHRGQAVRFFSTTQQPPPPILQRPLSTMPQLQHTDHDTAPFLLRSKQSLQFKYPSNKKQKQEVVQEKQQLTLQGFIDMIPQAIKLRQALLAQGHDIGTNNQAQTRDPVMALLRNLQLAPQDWAPYAHTDPARPYTRNLIATDDETYTLLLLCWNPDQESKIHDHPCDGCFLSVLQGQVQECRYEYPSSSSSMSSQEGEGGAQLQCIADETFTQGQVAFINDSIGLHKVANPSKDILAVSLHLYTPPFGECRVWVPDDDATTATPTCADCATYYSEYGQVL